MKTNLYKNKKILIYLKQFLIQIVIKIIENFNNLINI
jgi:hypothetical protein